MAFEAVPNVLSNKPIRLMFFFSPKYTSRIIKPDKYIYPQPTKRGIIERVKPACKLASGRPSMPAPIQQPAIRRVPPKIDFFLGLFK